MNDKDFYEKQWYYPPQREFHKPETVYKSAYHKSESEQPRRGLPLSLLIISYLVSLPLGVSLTFVHLYLTGVIGDKKKSQGYMDAVKKAAATAAQPKTTANPQPKAKENFKNPVTDKRFSKMSVALMVLGIILLFGGIDEITEAASWIHSMGGFAQAYASDLRDLWSGIATTIAGVGLSVAGWVNQKSLKVRVNLANIVGDAEVMSIDSIAKKAGLSRRACKKHLQTCIDQGYFGPDAYLDMSNDTLITSKADKALRDAMAKEQEKPAPEPKTPEQAKSQYQEILDTLCALDDAIPGEEMSQKIRRLSAVCQKIFKLVEEDPGKLPQLRRFMDYYLPTALKLLTSYSQLDAQGVEGENITQAKQKIESAMDGLCTAFEAQLDKLFAADALDISSDITVMENMLKADGLTENSDFNWDK